MGSSSPESAIGGQSTSEGPFQTDSPLSLEDTPITKQRTKQSRFNTGITLDQHLPLGSFTFSHDPSLCYKDEWIEFTEDALPPSLYESSIAEHVARLYLAGWIRLSLRPTNSQHDLLTARMYLLPDDLGRSIFPRNDKRLRACLRALMVNIDASPFSWAGDNNNKSFATYSQESGEDDSLFYIFNTLQSPQPTSEISDQYAAAAIKNVLFEDLRGFGLKTHLYPYQKRSVAEMIRRESTPGTSLDPRLETLKGPTGQIFYFDRDNGHVLIGKRTFDNARGGILAETMGYGKTLICLAAILTSQDTLPQVPPQHTIHAIRQNDGQGSRSLATMAAATAFRYNVQWKIYFNDMRGQGQSHDRSEDILRKIATKYSVHTPVKNRRFNTTNVQHFRIAATTLVIVPPNLLFQWKNEILKHLEEDALAILVVENRNVELPSSETLADYDMILMSRTRFEEEIRPRMGPDRDSWSTCRCHVNTRLCVQHDYRSPLLDIHFLRLIVDEGQGFVSSSTTSAQIALGKIKVERKWIVSGTPTSNLIGVEVDLAAEETFSTSKADSLLLDTESQHVLCQTTSSSDLKSPVQKTLLKRKKVPSIDQEKKDIERLGQIVQHFVQLQPWSNTTIDGDGANWKFHLVPKSAESRKPISLRNVLSNLVVRHRIQDIESDLTLPPLHNKTVKLQPSFFDKLSMNLFILVLATNAITSERTDQDYMFHPRNRRSLESLIRNMRSAAFFWSGISEDDIDKTCHAGQKYLDNPDHHISVQDRAMLETAMKVGQRALSSPAWVSFSRRSEIGLYVDDVPPTVNASWALASDENSHRALFGAAQLESMTKMVEKAMYSADPFEKLTAELDLSTPAPKQAQDAKKVGQSKDNSTTAKGVPNSTVQDPGRLAASAALSLRTGNRRNPFSPTKTTSKPRDSAAVTSTKGILAHNKDVKPPIPSAYSKISATKLIGTSSSKLSYLLDRIVELEKEEKILVFYEADYIAYYCAQALEVLGIPHFIYASGLSLKLRTEYQNMFNTDSVHRVMLMDIKQAALGLHMASASRVFFINPVWQPNIEAQAIKRAHRIGQTRPVYVETLILENTIEDQMLERRKAMTFQEQQKASKSLLDDNTMANLIKTMTLLPLEDNEVGNGSQGFAPLVKPQQVFGRQIAARYSSEELATAVEDLKKSSARLSSSTNLPSHPVKKKRKIMFADEATDMAPSPERSEVPDLPRVTTPRHIREIAKPEILFAVGREPPLDHVNPHRTMHRLADPDDEEDSHR